MELLTVSDGDYMIDKFKADLLYYKGQFKLALKIYKNIVSILPHTHEQVNQLYIINHLDFILLVLLEYHTLI